MYREQVLDGCDVLESVDGRDALVKALVRPPHLVLTELLLPLIDGFAFCEILRRDRATANVPIMVVTSEAGPSEADRALRAGADIVLAKPARAGVIQDEMQRLVLRGRESSLVNAVRRSSDQPRPSSPETVTGTPPAQYPRRERLSKLHRRFVTKVPPLTPPVLECPTCGGTLRYVASYVGGVSQFRSEQWDVYICPLDGRFEHRQRTKVVRRLA
jgi:CheY-like chemotaxis protein